VVALATAAVRWRDSTIFSGSRFGVSPFAG